MKLDIIRRKRPQPNEWRKVKKIQLTVARLQLLATTQQLLTVMSRDESYWIDKKILIS